MDEDDITGAGMFVSIWRPMTNSLVITSLSFPENESFPEEIFSVNGTCSMAKINQQSQQHLIDISVENTRWPGDGHNRYRSLGAKMLDYDNVGASKSSNSHKRSNSKRPRQTSHSNSNHQVNYNHSSIWDDSELIRAWDEAMTEYKVTGSLNLFVVNAWRKKFARFPEKGRGWATSAAAFTGK